MRPKTFGRALGIGVRVAGKALLTDSASPQKNAGAPTPEAIAAHQAAQQAAEAARLARVRAAGERGRHLGTHLGTNLGQGTRGVAKGTRNFGRAVWNPFALATSVLWLEITGMFFALFALFFAQHAFAVRTNYLAGPNHQRFLLYVALTLLFLYFSVTSFLRARQKSRKRPA
jgi:hypothetical protein